jgi:hypothetical protein
MKNESRAKRDDKGILAFVRACRIGSKSRWARDEGKPWLILIGCRRRSCANITLTL